MTELYNFSFEFCSCGEATENPSPLLCNGIVAGADYADAVANITATFRSDKNKISKLLVEEVGSSAVLIGNPKPISEKQNSGEQSSAEQGSPENEIANNE